MVLDSLSKVQLNLIPGIEFPPLSKVTGLGDGFLILGKSGNASTPSDSESIPFVWLTGGSCCEPSKNERLTVKSKKICLIN